MEEKDRMTDRLPDTGDGDDVEILEVIGVEDSFSEPALDEPFESCRGSDELGHDEYLLDFDEPPPGLSVGDGMIPDPRDYGNRSVDPERNGETDRQKLMRLRADYDNLRKRIDRERSEFELYANFALVGRLLPVMDNLERALAADISPEGPLREGLVMIRRQLSDQLEQDGLCVIETVGRSFDPVMHDAVVTEPSDEYPANTVLEELQKGYIFRDRVLRPAMVKVSTGIRGASRTSLPLADLPEQGE